jgi:hypothetical protein
VPRLAAAREVSMMIMRLPQQEHGRGITMRIL